MPDSGDASVLDGQYVRLITSDPDPPVNIRIIAYASLRLVLEAEPLVVQIGGDACGWSPGVLPPGSYLQTCEECGVAQSELSCMCRPLAGGLVPTSIDFSNCDTAQDLSNNDGVLQ
jgi:hypothetical protein